VEVCGFSRVGRAERWSVDDGPLQQTKDWAVSGQRPTRTAATGTTLHKWPL
jgi:hypothetical protein